MEKTCEIAANRLAQEVFWYEPAWLHRRSDDISSG